MGPKAKCEHGWPWFGDCPACAREDRVAGEWLSEDGKYRWTRYTNGDISCVYLPMYARLISQDCEAP